MTENTLQPTQTLSHRRNPSHVKEILRTTGLVVLQIVMTIWVITFLVPTIWMVSSSLKASTEVFAHPIVWIPEQPEWRNFAKVFELPALWQVCVQYTHRYRFGCFRNAGILDGGGLQLCPAEMAW